MCVTEGGWGGWCYTLVEQEGKMHCRVDVKLFVCVVKLVCIH